MRSKNRARHWALGTVSHFGQIAECWDFKHKIVTLVLSQFYFLCHLVKAPGVD